MILLPLLWTLIFPAQTPYDRRLEETQQKLQQMERQLHETRSRLEKLRRERANVASQEVALTQEMMTLARMLKVLDHMADPDGCPVPLDPNAGIGDHLYVYKRGRCRPQGLRPDHVGE
ncbi:MAG: hypothetical protein L3J76_01030, partial [Candidatus Hydrothermae bacterium]|nr:hypothetical protein [Candidatus Hydrothermae bacterium]